MLDILSLSPIASAIGGDPDLLVTLGALGACLLLIGLGLLASRLGASKGPADRACPGAGC